jgi:hypothetical protein
MKRFIILAIALLMTMCEKRETESTLNPFSELQNRYILKNVQCECFFENYDFKTNELWFFPESNIAISKGLGSTGLYASSPNLPENYRVKDDIIEFEKSGKSYYFRIENEILVLSNIDDPEIADDEIVYSFEKGAPLEGCIDDSLVGEISNCPAIYAPICGCDGFTYSNICDAASSGVISYTDGPCDSK